MVLNCRVGKTKKKKKKKKKRLKREGIWKCQAILIQEVIHVANKTKNKEPTRDIIRRKAKGR